MKKTLLSLLLFYGLITLNAQDSPDVTYIKNTFYGVKLVNGQSTELPLNGVLNFNVNHRFGQIKDGLYEFWGLDQAEIRLGFDYGVNDWLAFGIGRSSYQKTYDLSTKVKILRQQETGMPVTLTGFFGGYVNTLKNVYPEPNDKISDKTSYLGQLMLGHKISTRASLLLSAGWMYEGYSLISQSSFDAFVLGGGARLKVLPRVHLNAEYYHLSSSHPNTHNPFSLGIDLDTGGHLFQLILSNTQTTFEKSLLSDTYGDWLEGELYFGFNLIRVFYLK